MVTRREFLSGAAGLLALSGYASAGEALPRLMSAARVDGKDGGILWHGDATNFFHTPARGHALAHLPQGRIALMGRRPGLFSVIVDPGDINAPPQVFEPARNCRFSGHAAVAADGSCMITSEFDADSIEAVLVSREPGTGAQRTLWRPNGLEPHEVIFARDNSRVIAAFGGLIKDGGVAGPAFNPGGVKSEVLEIDPTSGSVLKRHSLGQEFASLSLRHLALAPDGETVAVAAQDQDLSITRPLVGLLRPGKGLELLPMPEIQEANFRGYVGSIAIDCGGEFVAAASPRGSIVGLWSLRDGSWIGALAVADVCGLAAGQESGTFWASTGHGAVLKIAAHRSGASIEARWKTGVGFDNHLIAI
jgi:uncharacterized protein